MTKHTGAGYIDELILINQINLRTLNGCTYNISDSKKKGPTDPDGDE